MNLPSHLKKGRGALDKAGMIAFAQALIRIPSVNDPELDRNEAPAAELVASKMRDFGWTPKVEEVAPGRPNVVAILEGNRPGPTLLFEGHTDVVTEGDPSLWDFDPFGGIIDEGRLLGRGSADMKSGVAAMMYAVDALTRDGDFAGRVVVAALVDEEGLMTGVKHFAQSPIAQHITAAVVCEPEAGEVCISQKGAIRLKVHIQGTMSHGAMPEVGRNPLLVLGALIQAISLLERDLQGRFPADPLLGKIYITPTVVQAGDEGQMNVIPGLGSMSIDVRTIPDVSHTEIIDKIGSLSKELAKELEMDATLEVIDDRPATRVSEDHPLVRAISAAHHLVSGENPRLGGVPGTTDGTILSRDAGIDVVVYGPGGKWIAHQVNEYVEIQEIVTAAEVYLMGAKIYLEGED